MQEEPQAKSDNGLLMGAVALLFLVNIGVDVGRRYHDRALAEARRSLADAESRAAANHAGLLAAAGDLAGARRVAAEYDREAQFLRAQNARLMCELDGALAPPPRPKAGGEDEQTRVDAETKARQDAARLGRE